MYDDLSGFPETATPRTESVDGNGNTVVILTYGPHSGPLDGSSVFTVTNTQSEGVDRAGHQLSVSVADLTFDLGTVAPTVTLTGMPTAGEVDGQASWTLTVSFSEAVEPLTAGDFTLTNCVAGAPQDQTGNVYFVTTPSSDGPVSYTLAAGSVADEHGNTLTTPATGSYTYDGTAPTITAVLTTNEPSRPMLGFGASMTKTELVPFTVTVVVEDDNLDTSYAGAVGDITGACIPDTVTASGSGDSLTFVYVFNNCDLLAAGLKTLTVVGGNFPIHDDNNAVKAGDTDFTFTYLGDVNTPPRVSNAIEDVAVNIDPELLVNVTSAFADVDDADSDLVWSAVRVLNGVEMALPGWLRFTSDEWSKSFSGTPSLADLDTHIIRVKVVDPSGATAFDDFELEVIDELRQGCRDKAALNYRPKAVIDGNCLYPPSPISKVEGGKISARRFNVSVPARALRRGGSNANIVAATVVAEELASLPLGKPAIAPVLQLLPSQTFTEPVEVCLDIPDHDLDRNTRNMAMYTSDNANGQWERTLTSVYDSSSKQLCGTTNHFFYFVGLEVSRKEGRGSCPNRCSAHGMCGPDGHCSCFRGYGGNDCSERMCKEGVAWVAGSATSPHEYAECSNNGECDRSSGLCQCSAGFEGATCDRTSCPNDCSGHGRCEFIQDFATSYDNTNWDHNKIRQCRCDGGYTGRDCSGRICPADDPKTLPESEQGEQWTYTISHGAAVTAGEYHLIVSDIFGGSFVTRAIGYGVSATEIKDALEATHGVVEIESVAFGTVDAQVTTVQVNLKNPPRVRGLVAEVKDCSVAGCFPKRMAVVGGPVYGSISERTRTLDAMLETATCSNRGGCDLSNGRCSCFAGFAGIACELESVLF